MVFGFGSFSPTLGFERTRKKRKLSQHALVERSPTCARASPVDEGLLVSFEETLGRSWMHIRFNTTLYTERAVLNVGRTCHKIFQELLNDSNQLVGKIRSLSDDDLDHILAWNSGDLASLDSTLHGEISKHVKDRPDAPALHAWDGSLTYHELDTVASNLQGHLCNLGPRIGEMVPVYFEKSLWAAVAMLGILKAGSAFVPLDPSNPLDRTKAIIKSVNARFVLTSSTHSHILESLGVKAIIVDERFKGAETALAVSVVKVSPRSPAFVLFTSGSTGQPKGVVQEHASLRIRRRYGRR
ncbi:MAG: hypothetical protein Q9194_002784 [Teloschistes cf. exilis]